MASKKNSSSHSMKEMSHCLFPTHRLLWNASHLGDLHVSPTVHWEQSTVKPFN